jgi:protein-disulfide isomerase
MFIMESQKTKFLWVLGVVATLLIGFTTRHFTSNQVVTEIPTQKLGILTEPVSTTDWTKGAKNPKITLVEYGDFACTTCRISSFMAEGVIAEYKDSATFTYRSFPLKGNKNALLAAYAAEAAGAQGKFWEMHQKLFETQRAWVTSNVAQKIFQEYARALKLDGVKFSIDLDSQKTKDAVLHDIQTGTAVGVTAPPSFYLNGKKMQTPQSSAELKALIEYVLVHK